MRTTIRRWAINISVAIVLVAMIFGAVLDATSSKATRRPTTTTTIGANRAGAATIHYEQRLQNYDDCLNGAALKAQGAISAGQPIPHLPTCIKPKSGAP
jgi:hypothetical protein